MLNRERKPQVFDFATLTQARQGLQKSDQLRHQQSAELYTQGRQLVREAMTKPMDKDKLKVATDCFAKGIQANYKNPANYLGMGFLFLLIGQSRQAIPYIRSGLDLEPGSELGKELLLQAQQDRFPKTDQKSDQLKLPQLLKPSAEIDFDEFYDSTQAAVKLFLRLIMMDEVLGYSPSPDLLQLDLISSKLNQFQEKAQEFNQQLQILDQEMEISDLRQQLIIIEKAIQRINSLKQLFEQFIEIDQDIKKHIDITHDVISQSQTTENENDLEALEENLQVLLDHCDSVADRLDDLEAKNIDINSLHSTYKDYVELLEHYQDVLEENSERLKSK